MSWQVVPDDEQPPKPQNMARTFRLRVPGGWLVRHVWYVNMTDGSIKAINETMCFVPRPTNSKPLPAGWNQELVEWDE